jgi:hypothetical protein
MLELDIIFRSRKTYVLLKIENSKYFSAICGMQTKIIFSNASGKSFQIGSAALCEKKKNDRLLENV